MWQQFSSSECRTSNVFSAQMPVYRLTSSQPVSLLKITYNLFIRKFSLNLLLAFHPKMLNQLESENEKQQSGK